MEWPFELLDKMSDPLRSIASSLDKLDAKLKGADQGLKKFDNTSKQSGGATGEASDGAMAMMGSLSQVGTFALEAGEKLAELAGKVVSLGAAFLETGLHQATFKKESLLALESMLGTPAAAQAAYKSLEHMAEGTKMTREQMVGLFTDLAAFQNLSQKNIEDILAASLDVGAQQGQGAQQQLLDTIKHAQATGKFDERALHGLRGVGAASPEKVIAYLAKQRHVSEAQIKRMLQAGQISAAEGTKALLDLVQQNVDKGGALGSMSKNVSGGDFFAQLKTMKDRLFELFENVDTGPLVDALKAIGGVLDPNSASAKRLSEIINKVFAGIGGLLSKLANPGAASKVFDGLVSALDFAWRAASKFATVFASTLQPAIARVAPVFEKMFASAKSGDGEGLMKVVAGLAGAFAGLVTAGIQVMTWIAQISYGIGDLGSSVVGGLSRAYGALSGFVDGMLSPFRSVASAIVSVGSSIVDGLWSGITGAWGGMLQKFHALVELLPASVRSVLGIHSPSTVMRGLAEHTVEGFEGPLDKFEPPNLGAMIVQQTKSEAPSYGAMLGSYASPVMADRGGGGGRSISIGDINVEVHTSKEDAKGIGDEVARTVRSEVIDLIDGLAFEN